MHNQRKEIEELLIDPYWRRDAPQIVGSALNAGWSLDEIAAMLTRFGTDVLILQTYWRKTLCGSFYDYSRY